MTIDEIRDNFALLEEWDDRYRYVIELGRTLKPLPEARAFAREQGAGLRQPGLAVQAVDRGEGEPRLNYLGDSDAHIVRGLIAILLDALFRPHAEGNSRNRRARRVRRVRLPRAPDAAALQRPALDGRAHPHRRARGAGRSVLILARRDCYLLRRRRCWPNPISLASCERATA